MKKQSKKFMGVLLVMSLIMALFASVPAIAHPSSAELVPAVGESVLLDFNFNSGVAFKGTYDFGNGIKLTNTLPDLANKVEQPKQYLEMGVKGAALATILSQIISFSLLLFGMKKGSNIKLSFKKFKLDFFYQKEIFKGGVPSLLRQGLASISTMILNNIAGGYSDAAIAGLSVVTRVSMFANSALIGFGQGFQPVVGFNYGAKLYERVKKAFSLEQTKPPRQQKWFIT